MMLPGKFMVSISLFLSPVVLADDHAFSISDAWVREAPPIQRILAGYMQIRNDTDTPRKITAVNSAIFGSVEIHKTVIKDGMARMEAQHALVIPAMGTTVLEPGGVHLMLIDPQKPLQAGDKVTLELQIAPDETQTIIAEVRRSEGVEPDHSHHHH